MNISRLLEAQLTLDPHAEAAAIYQPARALHGRFENRRRDSLRTAFMERIAFGMSECWHWIGSRSDIGYGMFAAARDSYGSEEIVAHRISWVLFRGPIPDGLKVLHRCDVRSCVNPEHLFLGTQAANVADMVNKGRNRCVPLYGSRNPMARLSEEKAVAIRAEHAAGVSQHSIAAKYNVSPMTINRLVNGKSWSTT